MTQKRTIVPAAPGYDVVDSVSDEAGNIVELSYTPVVAWAVEGGEDVLSAWPIALGLHDASHAGTFVRTPKGHYYDLEGNLFEGEQSVLEELQKRSA
jgi:hypothetical protein